MPSRLPSVWAYLLALTVGLAFSAWLFPISRLFPPHPLDIAFNGDAAQHMIGQRYFIRDAWRWPLLVVPRLDAPEGANVAFTDSIPLMIVPLKLIRAWLPDGFTGTELWVALAFILQPLAGVFALRSAGERRLIPAAAMAVLALSVPSLLLRFLGVHEALCSHFLLLVAIGIYFRQTGRGAGARGWTGVPALLLASLLIHPYLLAMVAILLTAAPMTLLMRRDRRWRGTSLVLGISCAVTAGVALTLDYGGTAAASGFGVYSMNLLGPVAPSFSSLFAGAGYDPTGGQKYEGYQYLGAGILLLAAAGLASGVTQARRVLDHGGLVVICLALVVFSVSNRAYFGDHLLFDLDPVPAFVRQFRASGRFFWPVGYVVIVASIAAIGSRTRLPGLSLILLACVGLQVADTAWLRDGLWQKERTSIDWAIPRQALLPAFASASHLTLWPLQDCVISTAGEPAYMQTLVLASVFNLTTNTMYMSRFRLAPICDPAIVLGKPWQAGELRVIAPPASPELRWLTPGADAACRQAGRLIMCATNAGVLAGLPPPSASVLPRGVPLAVTAPAMADALVWGWCAVEPTGVWSLGPEATLITDLAPGAPAPRMLTIRAIGLAAQAGGTQRVDVIVAGAVIATWLVPESPTGVFTAALPPDLAGKLVVTFRIAAPVRPVDRNIGEDARSLGLFLQTVRID